MLHDVWDAQSRRKKRPLDYLVMSPEDGTPWDDAKVQRMVRDLAHRFMPNPEEVCMLKQRSWRRWGGTMISIMKALPQDAVSLGGWAGVPELAEVVGDAK